MFNVALRIFSKPANFYSRARNFLKVRESLAVANTSRREPVLAANQFLSNLFNINTSVDTAMSRKFLPRTTSSNINREIMLSWIKAGWHYTIGTFVIIDKIYVIAQKSIKNNHLHQSRNHFELDPSNVMFSLVLFVKLSMLCHH